jgi:preprotein translocase subunit YajC
MQNLPVFILLFVGMYFLMIRPQKKRALEQKQMLSNLADGTEVMTGSGLYGFVTAIEGDVMWLEIADGVQVRVAKGSVVKVIDSVTDSGADSPAAPGELAPGTTPGDDSGTTQPGTDSEGSNGAN